jgi:hypothetical protein
MDAPRAGGLPAVPASAICCISIAERSPPHPGETIERASDRDVIRTRGTSLERRLLALFGNSPPTAR